MSSIVRYTGGDIEKVNVIEGELIHPVDSSVVPVTDPEVRSIAVRAEHIAQIAQNTANHALGKTRELEHQVGALQQVVRHLTAENDALRSDFNGLEAKVTGALEQITSEIVRIKNTADEALRQALENSQKIVGYERRLTTIEGKVDKYDNLIAQLSKIVSELQKNYTSLSQQVNSNTGNIRKNSEMISQLEGQFGDLKDVVNQIDRVVAGHQYRLTSLEEDTAQNTNEISRLKGEFATLESQVKQLNGKFTNLFEVLLSQVGNLEQRVRRVEEVLPRAIEAIQQELSQQRQQIVKNEGYLNALKEAVDEALKQMRLDVRGLEDSLNDHSSPFFRKLYKTVSEDLIRQGLIFQANSVRKSLPGGPSTQIVRPTEELTKNIRQTFTRIMYRTQGPVEGGNNRTPPSDFTHLNDEAFLKRVAANPTLVSWINSANDRLENVTEACSYCCERLDTLSRQNNFNLKIGFNFLGIWNFRRSSYYEEVETYLIVLTALLWGIIDPSVSDKDLQTQAEPLLLTLLNKINNEKDNPNFSTTRTAFIALVEHAARALGSTNPQLIAQLPKLRSTVGIQFSRTP